MVLVHALLSLAVARTQSSARIPTLLRGGTMGELFAVYVPRSDSDIQNSINFARGLSKSAAGDLAEARRLALDAKGG